jgi:transposase
MTTVTVHSGPERRRRWTSAEKLRIVEESLAGEASVADVARRHDIHPNQLHLWRRQVRAVVGSATGAAARFVPVRTAAADGVTSVGMRVPEAVLPIEIVLRNGRVLRVSDGVAPARAAALADALEGR